MDFLLTTIFGSNGSMNTSTRFIRSVFSHLHDHVIPHPRNNYRPHTLSNRALALYATLLISVKISVIALGVIGTPTNVDASAITKDNIFFLTNASRQANSLGTLKWNDVLARAAQKKADDMLAKGYFSHTSPDGRLPWDFITSEGYNYLTAGENLAEGFIEAEATSEAWMNSPGHRANILNKNFEELGVGISDGRYQGQRTIFVVQMFGTPMDQPIKVLENPTPVASLESQEVKKVQTSPNVHKTTEVTPRSVTITQDKPTLIKENNLTIDSARVFVKDDKVYITAKLSGEPVKVLALFGENGVVLDPKEGGVYEGSTKLSAVSNSKIVVEATDIRGDKVQKVLASFAPDIQTSYNPHGQVKGDTIELFGRSINLGMSEKWFYMLFVAVLLTLLVIAIALKKHVQHVGLVANTAFVVVLAVMFYVR